jgi:hypothetical protein
MNDALQTAPLPLLHSWRRAVWVLVGVLLLLGGIVAHRIWTTPTRILNASLDALQSVESVTYSAQGTFTLALDTPNALFADAIPTTFSFMVSGTDAVSAREQSFAITLASEGIETLDPIKLEIEGRYLNDTLYVHLKTLPPPFGADSTPADTWIAVSKGALATWTNAAGVATDTLPEQLLGLTREERSLIIDTAYDHRFLIPAGALVRNRVNGVIVNEVPFRIDTQILRDYLKVVLTEFSQNVSVDSLPEMAGTLWLGTDDHLPRKIMVSLGDHAKDVRGTITIDFSKYNDTVRVDIPQRIVPIETFLSDPTGSEGSTEEVIFFPDDMLTLPSPDNPDTDGDGLTDILEDFYGTDPLSADTDQDGYTDATEIENGFNPLDE